MTINTNFWEVSLHGKPICQTLLEATGNDTGFEDDKSHPPAASPSCTTGEKEQGMKEKEIKKKSLRFPFAA